MTYAWFDKGDGRQVYRRVPEASPDHRSPLACPMIITDAMDPAEHPLTGKMIASKSEFYRTTRAHGFDEVGNDPARLRPSIRPRPDRSVIRQALTKAKQQLASR